MNNVGQVDTTEDSLELQLPPPGSSEEFVAMLQERSETVRRLKIRVVFGEWAWLETFGFVGPLALLSISSTNFSHWILSES